MNRPTQAPGRSAVVEPAVERERASATPVATQRDPKRSRSTGRPPPDPLAGERPEGPAGAHELAIPGAGDRTPWERGALRRLPLRDLQAWFAGAIFTAASDVAEAEVEACASAILTAGPRLSAPERLAVYRRAYTARLVECLADDYPTLRTALGPERFESLCRGYIARHPSTSPNLNAYGRRMAEFCRDGAGAALRGEPCEEHRGDAVDCRFLADLASLEWAIVEVIHAPSDPPLTPAGLANVPADRWPDARLEPTSAFRLLRFAYPVNTYLQAVRQGEAPCIPAAAAAAAAVYRSGATVWRMDLSGPMFELLRSLASGESLGASIEGAAVGLADIDDHVAATRVMAWFREWVSSGLFSQVTFA